MDATNVPNTTPEATDRASSFRLESRTSASEFPAPSIWPMRMPTALPMDRNTTLPSWNKVLEMFWAGTTSRPQVE